MNEEAWSGRWTGSMHAIWDELLYLSALSRFKATVSIHPSHAYLSKRTKFSMRSVGRVLKRLEHLGYIKRWKQYNKIIDGVKVWFPRDIFISKKGYGSLQAKIADLLGRARRKKEALTPPQRSWWTRLFKDKPPPKNRRWVIPDEEHGQLATGSFRDNFKIPA